MLCMLSLFLLRLLLRLFRLLSRLLSCCFLRLWHVQPLQSQRHGKLWNKFVRTVTHSETWSPRLHWRRCRRWRHNLGDLTGWTAPVNATGTHTISTATAPRTLRTRFSVGSKLSHLLLRPHMDSTWYSEIGWVAERAIEAQTLSHPMLPGTAPGTHCHGTLQKATRPYVLSFWQTTLYWKTVVFRESIKYKIQSNLASKFFFLIADLTVESALCNDPKCQRLRSLHPPAGGGSTWHKMAVRHMWKYTLSS